MMWYIQGHHKNDILTEVINYRLLYTVTSVLPVHDEATEG